jgi:CBS domain containing-hemolysin-like protein
VNGLTTTDLWTLLIVAALTGIAAMLAMAETSLTRMSRARAMHLQEEQRRGAAQLLSLVEQPARFLNLVLLLLLVVQFTATALFTSVMDRIVGGGLGGGHRRPGHDPDHLHRGRGGAQDLRRPAHRPGRPGDRAVRLRAHRLPVLGPLTRLLIAIGNVVTPGKGLKSGPFVSEDEIKAMVDEAERDEVIEEGRAGDDPLDLRVRRHHPARGHGAPARTWSPCPSRPRSQQVLELILRTGYSRIPVYDGTVDEVGGLAYAKDVLRRLHDGQADKPLADILRPALFMPESMRAADCLREMRKRKSHMVIVIDEYGGTSAWSPWRTCWRRSSGRSPTSTTGRSRTSSPCPTATTGSTPAWTWTRSTSCWT